MNRKPIFDRLLPKLRHTDTGCIEWSGSVDSKGYGIIGKGGRGGGIVRVHRFVYETIHGCVPDGLELDHLCRNKRCCRISHLEPVTHRENILRGMAPSAIHARKTHCPKGHEYRVSTQLHPNGKRGIWRKCRQCNTDQKRAKRQSDPAVRARHYEAHKQWRLRKRLTENQLPGS